MPLPRRRQIVLSVSVIGLLMLAQPTPAFAGVAAPLDAARYATSS